MFPKTPKWLVIYTKFKCEKTVCTNLHRKGIEAYVPLKTIIKRYGRNKRRVQLPLIPCYVFVRISKKDYVSVLQTDNVIRFIQFGGRVAEVTTEEMQLMRGITQDPTYDVMVAPRTFTPGEKVMLRQGPLAGYQGTLVQVEGRKRLKLSLDYLDYEFHILVSPDQIQKTVTKAS